MDKLEKVVKSWYKNGVNIEVEDVTIYEKCDIYLLAHMGES